MSQGPLSLARRCEKIAAHLGRSPLKEEPKTQKDPVEAVIDTTSVPECAQDLAVPITSPDPTISVTDMNPESASRTNPMEATRKAARAANGQLVKPRRHQGTGAN